MQDETNRILEETCKAVLHKQSFDEIYDPCERYHKPTVKKWPCGHKKNTSKNKNEPIESATNFKEYYLRRGKDGCYEVTKHGTKYKWNKLNYEYFMNTYPCFFEISDSPHSFGNINKKHGQYKYYNLVENDYKNYKNSINKIKLAKKIIMSKHKVFEPAMAIQLKNKGVTIIGGRTSLY